MENLLNKTNSIFFIQIKKNDIEMTFAIFLTMFVAISHLNFFNRINLYVHTATCS